MNWDLIITGVVTFLTGGTLVTVLDYFRANQRDNTSQENKLINRQERRIHFLEEALAKANQRIAELSQEAGALREAVSRLEGARTSAIVVADMKGVICEWNPGATALLHWRSEEAVGKNVSMLIPPNLRHTHSKAFYEAIAKGSAGETTPPLETMALTRDGRTIPVEIEIRSWSDQGQVFFSAEIRRR